MALFAKAQAPLLRGFLELENGVPSHDTVSWLFRQLDVVRARWGVENQLHWQLDVVMDEAHDRSRLDNGPNNLAVLRHMALNVMQKDPT